jgi:hypothetical protein
MLDYFNLPVRDDVAEGTFGAMLQKFGGFPAPDAMSRLHGLGITVSQHNLVMLSAALASFQAFPSVHYSQAAVKREERIAYLARELRECLVDEEHEWRYFWGDVDQEEEQPEPEDTIEVASMLSDLQALKNGAEERAEWLRSAKTSPFEPGSNRAPRVRFFYWLLLLGFWKYRLGREIGTSSNDGAVYGPLVSFIKIMSERGVPEEELSGDAIRAFIRRIEEQGRIETVRSFFNR